MRLPRRPAGVSGGEFLRAIGQNPGCGANDLAREFAIAVGATSKGVDRPEAAGWVRRRPDPQNRSSSLISLTEEGEQRLAAATPAFEEELRTWLAGPLTPRALDQLGAALSSLRRAVRDAGAGTPAG